MPGRALTSTTYSPIAQIIATQYGLLISQAARKAETIQSNTVEDIQAEGKAHQCWFKAYISSTGPVS